MPDCVIYARLSQDQQGTEAGVERQVAECREYAAERGWTVVREYVDNDISATKGLRRPNFELLLSEVRSPTLVLCWHTDRLVRLTKDLERVIEAGLFVHAKHAGHLDLSTPAGKAVARTITAWAAYEGEQKSLRQKSAHVQRATSGRPFWNRRPFGYNVDGTEHPQEAEAVRYLYRQALIDPNLSALARWLNDRGFVTSAGGHWRGTGVRALLLGARNAGISTYHGKEVGPGNWTSLVDEQEYRAVARALGEARRFSGGSRLGQGGRLYLMTGFARCGVKTCGASVRIWWRDGKDCGYRVYACPDGHASARADWVDERAGAYIIERFQSDPSAAGPITSAGDNHDVEALQEEIKRLEQKGEGYAAMLHEDVMSPEQFASVNRANRTQIAELRTAIARVGLSTTLHSLLDVDNFADHWHNKLSVAEQHAIAINYFDRVLIMPRGKGRGRGMESGDVEFWVTGDQSPRY